MKPSVTFLASVLLLQGCSSWPEQGQGGVAELRPTALTDEDRVVLNRYFTGVEKMLVQLDQQGAGSCLPGRREGAGLKLQGAVRNLHAGMVDDALLTMQRLDTEVYLLQCRLTILQSVTGCGINGSEIDYTQDAWFTLDAFDGCHAGVGSASYTQPSYHLSVLNEALFDTDSSEIKPQFITQLDLVAVLLKSFPHSHALLTGHADARGESGYNDDLSIHRAERVAAHLIQLGVKREQLNVIAAGEFQPRGSNNSIEGRQLNRRVEIRIEGLPEGAQMQLSGEGV
ncbi:OmpA family protein [Pseudomonadota bacterium]